MKLRFIDVYACAVETAAGICGDIGLHFSGTC
jgi:hypothetical protein